MRKLSYLFFAVYGIVALSACQSKQEKAEPAVESAQINTPNTITLTTAQLNNMELKWEKPKQEAIAEKLMLKGKIDVPPQNLVSVSAPLGGYLKASHLLPGMHVKKGERLATLEDKLFVDMQEEYLSQNIKLSLLGMDSERQKALYAQKAASEKTMQEAVSAYQQQVVLVNALREKLRLINIDTKRLKPETISRSIDIYSPIDGYVSNVQTNVGKYVQPSDVLFELVNPADIHLNLTVYEKDIPRLHIGQQVSTYSNNDTTKKYPAQIILIGKDVSAERFVEVHCHFERYDNQLLPGMYMNAHVELDGIQGLVVPNDAIQRFEGREYVFARRSNQQFEMLEVKRIANNGQSSSLSSPQLNPNLEIVTKGAYTLLMKLKNTEAE